jgi:hypothetical protein
VLLPWHTDAVHQHDAARDFEFEIEFELPGNSWQFKANQAGDVPSSFGLKV